MPVIQRLDAFYYAAVAEQIDFRCYRKTACMVFLLWSMTRTKTTELQASIRVVTQPGAANEDLGKSSCRIGQTLIQAEM